MMLKKSLLLLTMSTALLFGVNENKIETVMNLKIQKVTALLQDKKMDRAGKENRIYMVMDPIFDYKTMSIVSLGKKWKKLNNEQKVVFTEKFSQKLKGSYFEKLELYTDQKVILKGQEKVKSNRIKVYSDIIGKDNTYRVIYKFYETEDEKDWLIYDVEIAGVSILQTYRKQFSEFLKTKSIDELIKSL